MKIYSLEFARNEQEIDNLILQLYLCTYRNGF